MKIALCSSSVPFVQGGYRNIVEWLRSSLVQEGHQVEVVYLPQSDEPEVLFQQMAAFRWVRLDDAERIVCFRPQSHLIPHPNKVVWFIHHIRAYYDLWDSPYRGVPDDTAHRGLRDALRDVDTLALKEATKVFANSAVVAGRLQQYNGVDSEVLYPPLFAPERFSCEGFNDEIVCVARLEHHKRQHLLIEALAFTRAPVRLRLAGVGSDRAYVADLRRRAHEARIADRVSIDDRWISEDEKLRLLAGCLATAYIPVDEDSYGYPSLESSHSAKPILTTTDAGGVLELVSDGLNGYVVESDPAALGDAMDRLFMERERTTAMGLAARSRIDDLDISWSRVLERLLA